MAQSGCSFRGTPVCGGRMLLLLLFSILAIFPACVLPSKISPLIEKISDQKDFKKLLRTRNNVLVLYSKSAVAADSSLRLLSDVAQAVKGRGTITWIDCGFDKHPPLHSKHQ